MGNLVAVDLTNYTKLYVNIPQTSTELDVRVQTTNAWADASNMPISRRFTSSDGTGDFYLDISSLTGNHYISAIQLQGGVSSGSGTVTFYDTYYYCCAYNSSYYGYVSKVWLE